MMEPRLMTCTFKTSAPILDAPKNAVPLEDLTIDLLLKNHFPDIRFVKHFRNAPFLQRRTFGQVMASSLTLNDFLVECKSTPGCGGTTLRRLQWVFEMAYAGNLNCSSCHQDALEDLTIDRLLKDHFPETRFLQQFRNAPVLQRVTLGHVMSSHSALNDFLVECKSMPGCGETAFRRLRLVVEMACAGTRPQQAQTRTCAA